MQKKKGLFLAKDTQKEVERIEKEVFEITRRFGANSAFIWFIHENPDGTTEENKLLCTHLQYGMKGHYPVMIAHLNALQNNPEEFEEIE